MLRKHALGCLCAITEAVAVSAACSDAHAEGKASIEAYGFVQADGSYDTNRTDPAWEDAFRPSKIPTDPGAFGGDGQTSLSVKQSRLGVQGSVPTYNDFGDVNFKFEFDFFGVGVDAGQTTIRLRHAYAEWRGFLAGQTNSLFMDGEVFPNIVEYWGPAGMVFYRNVQFRWTPYRTDNTHFALAFERPINDIDPGAIRQLDPELGTNLKSDEKLPDLSTQLYTSGRWGHAQLAGIFRRVGFETSGTPYNEPKGSEFGWGLNLSGHLALFKRDRLIGQIAYGQGIASYMNDGGVDLAPDGTPLNVHAKAVPLAGVVAYYDHYWTDSLSSSIGYSFTQVDNTSLQNDNAFRKGEYASVNLLYTPTKTLLFGAEAIWGQRTDKSGITGSDVRVQVSVKYDFSTKFGL